MQRLIAFLLALCISSSAFASSLTLTGVGKPATAAVASRTFNASASDINALTTYTFNLSTGATGGTNNVIGICTWRGAVDRTLSSATINTVAATIGVQTTSTTGTGVAIFGASTTTGASVDFVITLSGASGRAACASYTTFGVASLTPSATATDIAAPVSQSLSIPDNGVAFGGYMSTDTTTVTWGGLTEDVDAQVDSQVYSMASVDTTAASTPTVTVTPAGGSNDIVFAAASYGP